MRVSPPDSAEFALFFGFSFSRPGPKRGTWSRCPSQHEGFAFPQLIYRAWATLSANVAETGGERLATACARLSMPLLHARPYDPESRGKMEHFWRTLREGCVDFLGSLTSLHDVNVRLLAFLDAHYHRATHAGLFGKAPMPVFESGADAEFDETALREALTVRHRRRVRRDTCVKVDGQYFELDAGHLAGRMVHVCRCLVDLTEAP